MKLKFYMCKFSILIFVLFTLVSSVHSQTENKFGIKAGCIFTGISTSNDDKNLFYDSSTFLNHLNYTVGFYKEWFNTEKFCLSTELIYSTKGDINVFVKLVKDVSTNQGEFYESYYVSNRFQYLSLQLLPRYRIVLAPKSENMYIFGGPSLDLLVNNYISDDRTDFKKIDNMKLELGAVIGLGVELMNFLTFEFRFDHNFTGPYTISYGDKTIARRYSSAVFYTGISFNKFFKKKK
ncbi:MAG: PorT family protein [Ignavibacteriae bacterium]|nr:MAG: PorT family protein [Ignavibacteriota bacterium]